MLEPNVSQVRRQIADEREMNRKLDNSAVMLQNPSAQDLAEGVRKISRIVATRGIVNNSKPKPAVQNEFYQALAKSRPPVHAEKTTKAPEVTEPNASATGVKSLNLSSLKEAKKDSKASPDVGEKGEYQILNPDVKASYEKKSDLDNMFDPKIMSTQMQSSQDAIPQMSQLEEDPANKSRQSSCLENSLLKSNREKGVKMQEQ